MGGGTLALVGSEPAHPDEVLHEVRLQGLPVAVHAAATEHLEELRREFLLILDTSAILDAIAEVDAYCRRGDLLTLAISDEHHRYLRWVFGEFIRQVDGAAPTSWEEWVLSEPLPAVSASGGPVRAV